MILNFIFLLKLLFLFNLFRLWDIGVNFKMIDTKITINSLAEAISGKIVGSDDFRSPNGFTGIFNILKDSNEGDIVIRHWIDEKGIKIASSKNVACIITEDPRGNSVDIATDLKIPIIIVQKIEEANAIALNWSIKKFAPNSKRVIISGTNGKSTTAHMIYHILKSTGANALTNTDSKSEYNTLIDPMVPKIISEYSLSNEKSLEYLVIEASEVQGWLGKLMHHHALLMTKAVDPDVGVVTNVAIDHIGLVNSIEEVFEETSGIAMGMKKGSLVLNFDDKNVFRMANFAKKNIEPFYFSMNSNIGGYKNTNIDNIKSNSVDIDFHIKMDKILIYDTEIESIVFKSEPILSIDELPFNSNHFIQNTLAAISACLSLGIEIRDIINGIKSYKSLKRRFRKINHNPTIIDDFAHNPEGIKATVNAVSNLPHENLKILCAIRGSRGKEINEINAYALAEVINSINKKRFNKISISNSTDNSNSNSNNELTNNCSDIEIILSSSLDVVDEANFVEEFEEKIFFDVLKNEGIDFIHYKELKKAIDYVYNSSKVDDIILLIGAQGMDPVEGLLNDIINEDN